MHIEYAALTYAGRRSNNEDSLCAEPALGLYAVADGMGGYEGGEVASRLVVSTLSDFFRKNLEDGESTWPYGLHPGRNFLENLLDVAVRTANREVVARKKGPLSQMGSTVAAVAVRGRQLVVAHVGDSRVYRLRDGQLSQVTRDHSLYAELQAAGSESLPKKRDYPYANVITRAIGMDEARCDLSTDRLREGDVWLLCTDGLVETLEEPDITAVLSRESAEAACRVLVQQAYERGGRDNITAVVLRVVAGAAVKAA